jgi:hypothetical protein
MGLRVHCERYKTVPSRQSKTGRALRCADMRKNTHAGAQSPKCDRRLVGGGRSKGLLRKVGCERATHRRG